MEYRIRPSATHLIACSKHAPDHGFPVLAIARPGSWSKHQIGDLAQAGASIARVDRMKRMKPFRKLRMPTTMWNRRGEGADHGKPRFQMNVVWEVEAQGYRPSQDGAVDHVQSDGHAVPIDEQMLAHRPAQHADRWVAGVKDARAGSRDGTSPHGDDARVRDRRPDGLDGGAAVPRVFRESATPSPR